MNRYVLLIPFLFALLLISCRPEVEALSPSLPPTPVLTSSSIWGVVNIPYLKMLEGADPAADVAGLLREGDVVEVVSKVGLGDGLDYWLEIRGDQSSGWVPDESLDVYDSKAQAVTASSGMLAGS